nr:hypothetical protein [Pseudomonas sp. ITA]
MAADALTRLLHTAVGAAIEVAQWLFENAGEAMAENTVAAMETLDKNAKAIAGTILRLRLS